MVSNTKVKELFDEGADRYDGQRRKVIPCFDDFYSIAIDLIPFEREDRFAVLDLGAGTGLLTALILKKYPNAISSLVDVSEKMLQKAKERFEGHERIRFCIMDYAVSPLPDQFDLVVSALSIHHLSDPEKKHLFKRIYDALNSGGQFVHAELVRGTTNHTESAYQQMWNAHLKKTDISKEQLSLIFERMSYDKTTTLENQLNWLKEAGFEDVDCFYKYFNFAVYAGKKC